MGGTGTGIFFKVFNCLVLKHYLYCGKISVVDADLDWKKDPDSGKEKK
jgi:hypothetical protein